MVGLIKQSGPLRLLRGQYEVSASVQIYGDNGILQTGYVFTTQFMIK